MGRGFSVSLLRSLGSLSRAFGSLLESSGKALQGSAAYTERLSVHRTILPYHGSSSSASQTLAFLAPTALLVGDVAVGRAGSVWYSAVVRGDVARVVLGDNVHVQEHAVVGGVGLSGAGAQKQDAVVVGEGSVIGHGAIVQGGGTKIGKGCYVGPNAVLLEGVVLEDGSIVAPKALLKQGSVVKAGQVWGGVPAVCLQQLDVSEITAMVNDKVKEVSIMSGIYKIECEKDLDTIEAEKMKRKLRDIRTEDYSMHLGTTGMEDELAQIQTKNWEIERKARA